MPLPRTTLIAFAAALLAAPLAALGQTQQVDENPVVARVDGEEIRRSAVFALAGSLPQQLQSQIPQIYPLLVERLVDYTLANKAGRAAGLADDSEVKARMAELEDRVIREIWLGRAIDAGITDEDLQTRYQAYVAANPPAKEHHARHILLKTEEEAREVIAALDGGAEFTDLAKEHSTGPSGPQGGDLGYFRSEQMVPEFSTAAEALEPGQHTKDPVQTQFGWHVIRLEGRRETPPPGFAEIEPQLREEAAREVIDTVLKGLRDKAEVEITPAGTSLAPEGAATPAPEGAPTPAQ